MVKVFSWGRLEGAESDAHSLHQRGDVSRVIQRTGSGIAHGMGRSYGDACLNPACVIWKTAGLDHFIRWDEETGRLICEAGVLLRDIQRLMIPRGWMLPVTPGTQLVTVGGAIANDVHGKNHHVLGSFGDHVKGVTLCRTNGDVIECGPDHQSDWFKATVGGVGLTGVIVTADIQLRRVAGPWLEAETIPYSDIDEFFQLADASESAWEHTVSWIDCLSLKGRGLFMRANPIDKKERLISFPRQKKIPFVLPISFVNSFSLKPFNAAYFYLKKRQKGLSIASIESFSCPLDHILEWNRLYGPNGFFQYQSVVPRADALNTINRMRREIRAAGQGSFLAVLKTFGKKAPLGFLSFPQPNGVTLALDFPNKGKTTLALFERLDAIVHDAGGRIYLAKDACQSRDLFVSGYPKLEQFLSFRDPGISSQLSRRLMGY